MAHMEVLLQFKESDIQKCGLSPYLFFLSLPFAKRKPQFQESGNNAQGNLSSLLPLQSESHTLPRKGAFFTIVHVYTSIYTPKNAGN